MAKRISKIRDTVNITVKVRRSVSRSWDFVSYDNVIVLCAIVR